MSGSGWMDEMAAVAKAAVPLLACTRGYGIVAPHVATREGDSGWRVSLCGVMEGHLELSGYGVMNQYEARELAALLLAGAWAIEQREKEASNIVI